MLTKLSIQNYALIQSLVLEPDATLNIITGETGAGKSILLGAVGLLLGNRADTKVLLNSSVKCIIEGEFEISDYDLGPQFEAMDLDYFSETVIRREIAPSGKSRAFINDSPVTLDSLRALGNFLMDIHSQSDTILLGQPNYQLQIIDDYAQTSALLKKYQLSFRDYTNCHSALDLLREQAERITKEADYNNFLLNELEDAKLDVNEQQLLEDELKVLEHAEEIKSKLTEAQVFLDAEDRGISVGLKQVKFLLSQLSGYGEKFAALSNLFDKASIEIEELSRDIAIEESRIEVDFDRTEEVNNRLGFIFTLQQKHRVNTIDELLQILARLEEDAQTAYNLDEQIEKQTNDLTEAQKLVNQLGDELSGGRQAILNNFIGSLTGLLQQVGIPEAEVKIKHKLIDPSLNGKDSITIYFSANKGYPPAPLKEVASGGEFSRLMFCIKYLLADKTALPTIVFDEIDTGISGEIALKVGSMMKTMASNHQVIAITHLPQIAAKGTFHYCVFKESDTEKATSNIRKLIAENRIEEIAKMIGGEKPSESAYTNARELIAM